MYSFDIWNKAVEWCRENGIKIMMDVHCATTNAAGHNYALWYDNKYSEKDWLDALAWFADYYKDDDTVIAIDLKNEPHGKKDEGIFAKWDGSSDANNWRYAAEKGAKACLDKNPNLLIMVEGIESYPKFELGFDWNSNSTDYAHYGDPDYQPYHGAWWGGNFRGARDYPVNLGKYQSQLVYSPHDYGPLVYEQSWFHLQGKGPNYTSYKFDRESLLKEYWYDSWAFLVEEKISPLLMGEWGGRIDSVNDPSGANKHWMEVLRDYMIDKRIHHTFWCFNENSSDTGGLIASDCNWDHWDEEKYEFVKPSLWQDEKGKFISLDHKIKLGKSGNGISLSDYYSTSHTTPDPDPQPQKNDYPKNIKVNYNTQYHQVQFIWDKVQGADKYGIAVYLAGKWRVQTSNITTNNYITPKNLTPGMTYKVAIAARVNGKWNTTDPIKNAVTITIK
jgi:aryl-phospho-beta-D-glucosidase BglC (GH1 family)